MMRKYLNLLLSVPFVLGLTSSVYAITVPGDCRSPNVCFACHTPEFIAGVELGCDRGAWSATGPMTIGRFVNGGSLLHDGRYLVTGGATPPFFGVSDTAEILIPQHELSNYLLTRWHSRDGVINKQLLQMVKCLSQEGEMLLSNSPGISPGCN